MTDWKKNQNDSGLLENTGANSFKILKEDNFFAYTDPLMLNFIYVPKIHLFYTYKHSAYIDRYIYLWKTAKIK